MKNKQNNNINSSIDIGDFRIVELLRTESIVYITSVLLENSPHSYVFNGITLNDILKVIDKNREILEVQDKHLIDKSVTTKFNFVNYLNYHKVIQIKDIPILKLHCLFMWLINTESSKDDYEEQYLEYIDNLLDKHNELKERSKNRSEYNKLKIKI